MYEFEMLDYFNLFHLFGRLSGQDASLFWKILSKLYAVLFSYIPYQSCPCS